MGKLRLGGITNIIILLLLFLIIIGLLVKLKRQRRQEVLKTRQTETLWSTSHKLRSAMGMEEIIEAGAGQVMELLDRSVVCYDTSKGMPAMPKLLYCPDAVIHIMAKNMGEEVALEVVDDGPGITDAEKERVLIESLHRTVTFKQNLYIHNVIMSKDFRGRWKD